MKCLLFFSLLTYTVNMVFAQKNDSVTVDYKYAGILANFNFHEDRFYQSKGVSCRVGGGASWYASPRIRFQSWAFLDYDGSTVLKNMMFGMHYNPAKNITLSIGNIPTLTATTRPVPVTAAGHFEPWTPSQLTGLAPGISARYANGKNDFGTGVSYRINNAEAHARMKLGKFVSAGYVNANQKNWGATAGLVEENFSFRIIATDSLYGSLFFGEMIPVYKIFGYLDLGANHQLRVLRAETGIVKFFTQNQFNGLLGIGYSYDLRAVKCYLHFYL